MLKIFISHSTKDRKLVNELANYLNENQISPYIAERDYKIGKPLSQKIIDNIETSDFFLVLYTFHGKESGFVNQEVGYWIKAHSFNNFIPLVESGVKTEGFLSGLEYIEYDKENPTIGINNTINYLNEMKKVKEIDYSGLNVIIGLGILGLVALIIYGIYKLEKN